MNKRNIILSIVLIIIVGIVLAYFFKQRPLQRAVTDKSAIESIVSPTTPPMPETPVGWEKYSDEELGISFAIPSDFDIIEDDKYSVLIGPSEGKPSAGETRFFYVSIVPKGYPDEVGDIYNYYGPYHRKLLESAVNDRISLSDIEGQKDWFIYERYGDDIFNRRTAKVFINQRPWEFPNGTWEYRYIFELPEKSVIAGAYIEGGPSDSYFTLPLLTQIMNTLVIK